MASEITHVVYANAVRKKFLNNKKIDKAKFYVGNVFPDIRYQGGIKRSETHAKNPTVKNLLQINNSFKLGMYTHSLIDRERENVLRKSGFYNLFPKVDLLPSVIKFIEDKVTYHRVKNWPQIISYFDVIFDEEMELVKKDVALRWHKLNQQYFKQPPDKKTISDFLIGLRMEKNTIEKALQVMDKIEKNEQAMEAIKNTESRLFER